ncbi:tyrosine-type recombinase/integrase [Marinithermus hydrothermalis]|uniref:Integrase family protein n=1 Tax=Marinithermus hydrothermalis (strain DSM 14884 / JCM 11576 / T1) TaxID=869210 RepID=F2NQM0_MARHT|nr:tyrosine-type recombinase/integrase [Marinithermus hydrothermalis]AEB11958.1 integrase family protein [Marinithermus hydrothermalis DSM 14884]
MLVPTRNWHDPQKRRLEAIRAAQERDETALLELLEAYLRLKSRKKAATSPQTLRTYRVAVRDYLAWAWPPEAEGPVVPLLKATADDLDRYVADLQTHGGHLPETSAPLKPSTIATYLAGVRAFYRALEWAGAARLPEGVAAPRDPTPREERRPALPLRLYRALLEHLAGEEPRVLRDRVAVRLLGEVGLRISEVIHLKVEDVHLAEGLLVVRRGKGGKQRTLPLPRGVQRDLAAWLRVRAAHAAPGEDTLLVNLGGRKNRGRAVSDSTLRKTLNRYYRALGFPARYRGAHMLRHTAGTRFYKATRDLHVTARLLGHSNINTTAIYAKMDLEGLREAVERLEDLE